MYNTMRYIQLKITTTNQNHLHRKKITIAVQILNEKKKFDVYKTRKKAKNTRSKKGKQYRENIVHLLRQGFRFGATISRSEKRKFFDGKNRGKLPGAFSPRRRKQQQDTKSLLD